MEFRARESVILAADFAAMVAWYQEALGFKIQKLFEDGFHFCNLESDSGIKIGIGSAGEMGITPGERANNTVVLQFEVDDLKAFFAELEGKGATITNGPSFDPNGKFWFGGFADPEGNPFWVVDKDCP